MASERRQSRIAAGLPPVTAARIVEAALTLTREHGLDGWSVRQLAGALEVYPTVVYHHVGDREAVVDAVTEAVVASMPVPDPGPDWRTWFTVLLLEGRTVMRRHPGVARRIVLEGPTVPSALPTIDTGVQILQDAGFGDRATLVYRYLFNSAFLLVAAEDDRAASLLGKRGSSSLVEALAFYENDPEHPGLAAAAADAGRRARATVPDEVAAEFYEFALARTLDGAAALLSGS